MTEQQSVRYDKCHAAVFDALNKLGQEHDPQPLISAMTAASASALGRFLALSDTADGSEMGGLISEFAESFRKAALTAYKDAKSEVAKAEA